MPKIYNRSDILEHRYIISDKERYQWFKLWCDGLSCQKISERYGRNYNTIADFIRTFLGIDELPQTCTRTLNTEHEI